MKSTDKYVEIKKSQFTKLSEYTLALIISGHYTMFENLEEANTYVICRGEEGNVTFVDEVGEFVFGFSSSMHTGRPVILID